MKGVKGISAKFMKQYYYSIALLKLLYTADLFMIPATKISKGTVRYINKLVRIHRQALIHITGAMNTTATDAMEAHANIPSFSILLKKKMF